MKSRMLVMTPFTGLGLFCGFRGNRWLRNRIKVFEAFVIPSLLNQTDRDFTLWVCWRREERENKQVKDLFLRLQVLPFPVVFTYSGIPIYDDKYDDQTARERLYQTIKNFPELMDAVPDCDELYMLIQPSDDLYDRNTIDSVKRAFQRKETQAVVFEHGYICNYSTLEVKEYNPTTTPPFAAIKFDREVFFSPEKHLKYVALKRDSGKYKAGTPYPSHEYLKDCFNTGVFQGRGFLVGTHGENISTHWNHPFSGASVEGVLGNFGIAEVKPLVLP